MDVIDGTSGELVTAIQGLKGEAHGIAFLDGHGLIVDGGAASVVVFDTTTFQVIKRIPVSKGPDSICVDSATHKIFVISGEQGVVTIIDGRTYLTDGRVVVGRALEAAAADGSGHLLVNGADQNELIRIGIGKRQVEARWPLKECRQPTGLAIDAARSAAYVSCKNSRLVGVDISSGKILGRVPIGRGSDTVVLDSKRQRILSANGVDGTISIIAVSDAHTYELFETVRSGFSGRTLAVDENSGRIFVTVPVSRGSKLIALGSPHPYVPFVKGSLALHIYEQSQ